MKSAFDDLPPNTQLDIRKDGAPPFTRNVLVCAHNGDHWVWDVAYSTGTTWDFGGIEVDHAEAPIYQKLPKIIKENS